MADMLRPRLDRLDELSKKLNSSTDDAGKIVQGVENYLSDILHLGTSGAVMIDSDDDPRNASFSSTHLVYGRLCSKYRIYISCTEEFHGRQELPEDTPWANCSRELKLQSFARLPDLLDKLIENLERAIQQVADNSELIQSLLPPAKGKGAKS